MIAHYRQGAAAIAVERSGDSKLGKNRVSATYASQETCAPSCPFLKNGCYAETGRINMVRIALAAYGGVTPEEAAAQEAAEIRQLSGRFPLRLHVVGDCTTNTAAHILADAAAEYTAKHNQPVWTYTHAWRDVDRDAWGSISVLASCETPDDLRLARQRGYAPVMVREIESRKAFDLGDGMRGVPCPQQWQPGQVSCESCRLCMRDQKLYKRGDVIVMKPHGIQVKRVQSAIARRLAKDC